jgi:DNA gyrase subunit A
VTQPGPRNERIVPRLLEDEMRDSFIDYSMSVIVQRALPDARDGLKPVHRRILYAMYEQGLLPDRAYRKSATVVGDVLGKYHPHGDSAVYDTLVRMVQDFSLRYPLIDGQGNFGSIDGDSAAAYRYTEAKLAPIAIELLDDLAEDTVDFVANFDGSNEEPTALPARLPHLLLNGSDGIAVGMATKIPPHNLRELVAATQLLLEQPECELEELAALIEGPDFPTGGYIWGYEGIGDAYRTGRGLVEMRARMHLEEGSYGKRSLVVTELPYQVNKSRVIEQITKVVKSGRVEAISDLRDESDRDGLRLVIELKRDANVKKILKALFLKTQLKSTFGVIMLALVDNRPVQLNLKEALECFVDHRLNVIRRRAAFKMERAEARAHVLEGLLTALDDIDRVIEIIRGSTSPAVAADRLCAAFGLTSTQADAILAMRLARLTQLEGKKLLEELEELKARIEELRHLVEEDGARRALLSEELADLAARFGDERRTVVLDESQPFPLPSEDDTGSSLVLVSRHGYVKAQPVRGGRSEGLAGAEAMAEREGDFVTHAFLGRADTELLFFTAGGTVKSVSIGDLPIGTRSSRGRPLAELLELEADDPIIAIHPVPDTSEERFVLTVSRLGQVKRTSLEEYGNVRGTGIIAAGLGDDDRLVDVHLTDGAADLVLGTRHGMMIRFDESEVRPMGRSAKGVKGIDLEDGDEVAVSATPDPDVDLMVVTRPGRAKRFPLTEVRQQGRAGKGVTVVPDVERVGDVVGLVAARGDVPLVFELASGAIAPGRAGIVRQSDRRAAARVVRDLERLGDLAGVHLRLGGIAVAETGREPPDAPESAESGATPEAAESAEATGGVDAGGDGSVGAGASQGELDLPAES